MVVAREDGLEVVLLAGLWGPPVEEAEGVPGEAGLRDEGGETGEEEGEDDERREVEQQRAEALIEALLARLEIRRF